MDPALEALINELPDGTESNNEEKNQDVDVNAEGSEESNQDNEETVETEETEENTEPEEDADSEEESESSDKSEKEDSDEEEGYTIDGDGEEEADKPEDQITTNSTEEAKQNPNSLTPEQQYILDNIAPIRVRGVVGDSEEVKDYEVLTPEQLPDGFKFLDDRSRSIADKQFSSLESKAKELENIYRNQETNKSAQAFKQAEDNADRADIGRLQREGQIPLFKAQLNSPEFESDPSVKLVQDILDFKEQQNNKYLSDYQNGKPYRHIGFEEAFDKYVKLNPNINKVSAAQTKEDKERVAIARRTGKTSGTQSKRTTEEPAIFRSSRDINNYIDNLGWE